MAMVLEGPSPFLLPTEKSVPFFFDTICSYERFLMEYKFTRTYIESQIHFQCRETDFKTDILLEKSLTFPFHSQSTDVRRCTSPISGSFARLFRTHVHSIIAAFRRIRIHFRRISEVRGHTAIKMRQFFQFLYKLSNENASNDHFTTMKQRD